MLTKSISDKLLLQLLRLLIQNQQFVYPPPLSYIGYFYIIAA